VHRATLPFLVVFVSAFLSIHATFYLLLVVRTEVYNTIMDIVYYLKDTYESRWELALVSVYSKNDLFVE